MIDDKQNAQLMPKQIPTAQKRAIVSLPKFPFTQQPSKKNTNYDLSYYIPLPLDKLYELIILESIYHQMFVANETIFNNWKSFIYTQTQNIIQTNLCNVGKYDSLHSKEWCNAICEQIIGKLSTTNHHFKYIVNCIILGVGCHGMDVSGLCYYDAEMDGSVTVKWENKALICIVNVYGCAA